MNTWKELFYKSQPLTEVIYSNVKEVVDQGQYVFDTFWKNATPPKKKIKNIDEGNFVNTDFKPNPEKSLKLVTR